MKDFAVIEFRKPIISGDGLKFKTYKIEDKVLVELLHSRLLVHPSIVYDLHSKFLNIDLAPFIKIGDDRTLTTYSIAVEDLVMEPSPVTCSVCKYVVLDSASIIALDSITGKPLKILKVVPYVGVKVLDMLNHNIYIRALHPQYTYALYLSDKGAIGKVVAADAEAYIEEILLCSKYRTREYKNHTLSLCFSSDKIYATVGSNIYGFHVELSNHTSNNDVDLDKVHGYSLNNLCFIKLGRKGYVCKLKNISSADTCYEVENVYPLAFLSDDVLVALESNNSLFLLDLNRKHIDIITKVYPSKLLGHFIDLKHKYIVLTYDDGMYIHSIEDKPVYVKIKDNSVLASVLANDKLLVFKKSCIDLYEVDVRSNHIYIEKLFSSPNYITSCTTLEEDIVLCVDRKGRLIIEQVEKLFKIIPMVKILRNNGGITLNSYGDLIPLLVNPIYEDSLFRVRSDNCFLRLDNLNNFDEVFSYNIKPKDVSFSNTFNEIPKDLNNLRILLLRDRYFILGSPAKQSLGDFKLTIFDYDYSKQDRKVTLTRERNYVRGNTGFSSKYTKVYVVKNSELIEWGISVNKSSIQSIDVDKIIRYNGNRLCLASENLENIFIQHKDLSLTALCSNTIMKGFCVDISSCERLLKILLEVGDVSLSLPIQFLTTPKISFEDGYSQAVVTFKQGVQHIILPSKCVELTYASLNLLNSIVTLRITNKCHNVGGTVAVEDTILFVEPNEEKEVKIRINLNHILNDSGLQINILESNGNSRWYTLSTDLKHVIPKAISIALKIAKIVGIRSSAIKIPNNVFENSH